MFTIRVSGTVHIFNLVIIFNVLCYLSFTCQQVPLDDATVDIAVFCLSLMGTNLGDFLIEANRVLVMG